MTRARVNVVKYIESQLDTECKLKRHGKWHYGREELRLLMDFIYMSKPKSEEERIK